MEGRETREQQAAGVDIAQEVGKDIGETNLDSTGLHRASDCLYLILFLQYNFFKWSL